MVEKGRRKNSGQSQKETLDIGKRRTSGYVSSTLEGRQTKRETESPKERGWVNEKGLLKTKDKSTAASVL